MATSYFRQRARNPYLRNIPGLEDNPHISPINPDAPRPPMLPNIPAPNPRPMPLPPTGIPGGERASIPGIFGPSPLPETISPREVMLPARGVPGGERSNIPGVRASRPPTRLEELDEMKDAYLSGTPSRWKSGLLNALKGGLTGLATGGGLGAALGGAISGGAFGAINPRGAREARFEREEKPEIMERFAFEDKDRMARMATEKAMREDQFNQARIDEITGQNRAREAGAALDREKFDFERGRQMIVPPEATVFDPRTQQSVFTAQPRQQPPKPPTAAELTIDPESGKSAEEKARDSYEARGGDNYVRSKLPTRTRQILEVGTVTAGGKTRPAIQTERDVAQKEFERAIQRQLNADMSYTHGAIRSKRVGGSKPRSGAKPPGSQSGISRPRSQFNTNKYPGLRFD